MLNVTIWNEFRQERTDPAVQAVYPQGIHAPIAAYLAEQGFSVTVATMDEPEHGLPQPLLEKTDVLVWWGHRVHHEVRDDVVARIHARVLEGMGLIALHSSHFSKIFCLLMDTTCRLKHHVKGERERIWCVAPQHPIAAGLPACIELPQTEMYGEHFDIPAPDELVFISSFEGGEVFRSGCCWQRGQGKVFYFRPGHETYPIYYRPDILQVIGNAVRWAK